MKWMDGITGSMDMNLGKLQELVMCCGSWGHKELDMTKQLNNKNNFKILFPQEIHYVI